MRYLASKEKPPSDAALNTNGRTEQKRSPFEGTRGFVNVNSKAAMPLSSSAGSITKDYPEDVENLLCEGNGTLSESQPI